MPNVIEHIYWIQKHRNASGDLDDVDADLLLDLQEYFGYPFNRIVPRVQEIVSLQHHPLGGAIVEGRGDVPTGKELVRFHATEYFKTLSMEADNTTTVPPERRAAWVADEVAHFTQSMVVRVFGCTWMNLAPFLTRYALLDNSIAAKGDVYEDVVYQIVAACYVLSTDDRARVWMAGFVHRLRQIQLSLHLQELEIRMNHLGKKTTVGPYDPLPLAVFQGLDIYRWSSLSRQLQQRRFLADWGEEGHQTEPFFRDFVKEDSNATKWQPTLDGKALCESVKTGLQTLMSKLPQLRRPKVPYEVMSASEPPQPELHGALRRRKNQRYPATATARATTEDDNDGGHLWRPPGALFMKPRKVNWPEGERQQYLYGRNAQNVPAKDDLRVKIRYDPNPPPPPQFTPKIDQPKTAEDDSSSEDTWRQPLQFDIHEEGKDTKTLTARIHPRAGGDVEAQLIRHRSDSSSSLPAGVHAFQFYREDDSPRVEYRGPGVVKGGRRVR
ncbi:MAG: uncharacterized protein KVP18_003727 [Porospora cf. gigantea A]|nr:MAG: hypothetical protein KVP18_003727 [Porospora cf. gigantea A]